MTHAAQAWVPCRARPVLPSVRPICPPMSIPREEETTGTDIRQRIRLIGQEPGAEYPRLTGYLPAPASGLLRRVRQLPTIQVR